MITDARVLELARKYEQYEGSNEPTLRGPGVLEFARALLAEHEGQKVVLYTADESGAMNCACDHFQCPAAGMCARCPRREATIKRDLECWSMVIELRGDEANSLDIFPDNVDFNGHKNCAVEATGDWTAFCPVRYEGDSLHEALTAALAAKRAWQPELPAGVIVGRSSEATPL